MPYKIELQDAPSERFKNFTRDQKSFLGNHLLNLAESPATLSIYSPALVCTPGCHLSSVKRRTSEGFEVFSVEFVYSDDDTTLIITAVGHYFTKSR